MRLWRACEPFQRVLRPVGSQRGLGDPDVGTHPARVDDEIGGQTIKAGATVIISPWILQRHQLLWDDPDAFKPERFLPENRKAIDRYAYIPFSAGQRVCPGAGFAMIEGPLMLAVICRELRLSRGTVDPVPVARLTVRGRDGIRLRIARR